MFAGPYDGIMSALIMKLFNAVGQKFNRNDNGGRGNPGVKQVIKRSAYV